MFFEHLLWPGPLLSSGDAAANNTDKSPVFMRIAQGYRGHNNFCHMVVKCYRENTAGMADRRVGRAGN